MPDPFQQPDPRPTGPRRPTHQVGPPPEQDEDPPVLGLGRLLAAVDYETPGRPPRQSSTRRGQPGCPPPSHAGSVPTTGRIRPQVALQDISPKARTNLGHRPDLDTPQTPVDSLELGGVGDLLVTQELGPRSVGGVGQVVNRPLPLVMPAGGRLVGGLPKEREAPIDVAIGDQVDPKLSNDRDSPRTARGPGSSGSQSPVSTASGDRPSSAVRGRPNHRLTPKSL